MVRVEVRVFTNMPSGLQSCHDDQGCDGVSADVALPQPGKHGQPTERHLESKDNSIR